MGLMHFCFACDDDFPTVKLQGRYYCRPCADVEDLYSRRVLKARMYHADSRGDQETFDRLVKVATFLGRTATREG